MATRTIPWEALQDNRVRSPLRNFARAAARAVCGVRALNPYLFHAAVDPGIAPVPTDRAQSFQRARRAFWEDVCQDNPEPGAFQRVEFQGGQCVGTAYSVVGNHRRTDGFTQAIGVNNVIGPIQEIYWTRAVNGSNYQYFINARGANGVLQTSSSVGAEPIDAPVIYDRFVTISPQLPNCGNRDFPIPIPNTPPPTVYIIPQIQINNQQRDVEVILRDVNFDLWPDFEFNPSFRVDGIDVDINLDGINIDFPDDRNFPPGSSDFDDSEILNRIDEARINLSTEISQVSTQIADLGTLLTEEIDDLESLIRCCCCDEGVTFTSQILVSDTFGGTFELPDNCVAATITVADDVTPGTKIQYGSGTAPNVYYWGWYSIGSDVNNPGNRSELHYLNQAIFLPKFARSLTVNPVYGNKATVIVVIRQPCS